MLAASELLIYNEIQDMLLEKEDLPNNIEIEIPDEWKGINGPLAYPDDGEAEVSVNGKVIGRVNWDLDFWIQKINGVRSIGYAIIWVGYEENG